MAPYVTILINRVPGRGHVATPITPSIKSLTRHSMARTSPRANTAHKSTIGGVKAEPPLVLTIAGSDSGGGAGIQADLKTFAACGVFGCSAITAITAQNTQGVSGIFEIPVDFLGRQIDAVLDDLSVSTVKTGMLPSVEAVSEVAASLRTRNSIQLVVDPVLVATSGDNLATSDVGDAMSKELFPLATVITPNLPEAAALLKWEGTISWDVDRMKVAAAELQSLGPECVLVKGGHLEDPDASYDVLYDGKEHTVLSGPIIDTKNTHGTGCTIASAIASFLARGMAVPEAVKAAKSYITEALRHSDHLKIGRGGQKPFNHAFSVDDWRDKPPLDISVYGVTDPACNAKQNRSNAQAVKAAIEGGVSIVQLREKDIDGAVFCREARSVIDVARPKGVPVLINDRIDVALAVKADGVHVGQDDIEASVARRLLGKDMILGVSVKTVDQARCAEAAGANYLGAGAMFPTATKESSRISHEALAEICQAVSIPVVAIGGIQAGNAAGCIQAGCAGVAVVSAIFGAPDPAKAAQDIKKAVSDAKQ